MTPEGTQRGLRQRLHLNTDTLTTLWDLFAGRQNTKGVRRSLSPFFSFFVKLVRCCKMTLNFGHRKITTHEDTP